MNNNLRQIMKEKNITVRALSRILGISEASVQNKMRGVSDWTLTEAETIMELFPQYTLSWLFKREAEVETA